MSLLGIDIGTSGCKAVVFGLDGTLLGLAYREYDVQVPQPGWAELDAPAVWELAGETIREAAAYAAADPIQALSVSSMGEAVVPVNAERQILGPSLLNFDVRGDQYLPRLADTMPDERLYRINGNALGSPYGLTKLIWLKHYRPELYAKTTWFLTWSGLTAFLLGGEAHCDPTLANRLLLYDLEKADWSDELLDWAGLDRAKLAPIVPAGSVVGQVSAQAAALYHLPEGTPIVAGAHDQQCNTLGCGAARAGQAMYGMGSYLCAVPVLTRRPPVEVMLESGLSTEDHAVPGQYVTFIYNQGGVLVKWFRDTFARQETVEARKHGMGIYDLLLAEMPEVPSSVLVLPHFTTTGPPSFLSDTSGVLSGLRLETTRGEILKGIIECSTYYLRQIFEQIPREIIPMDEFIAAGGGSQSQCWLQLSADILGKPFTRLLSHEAGALGAAILAGHGVGLFSSLSAGVEQMVKRGETIYPRPEWQARYEPNYARYRDLAGDMEVLGRLTRQHGKGDQ